MDSKEELHSLVEQLTPEEAADACAYVRLLLEARIVLMNVLTETELAAVATLHQALSR